MPLYRTYRKDNLTVGVWKVDETVGQLRSMFHHFSIYEEGFSRFTSEKRQQEWLAVRVLLKELCGEEKEIVYHPSGKPYLKDGSAFISFSHTHGYVSVALHPYAEVGVDIEQYGTRVQRVASRFIREDERVSVEAGDEVYAMLLHVLPFRPEQSGTFEACEYRSGRNQKFLVHYDTHPDYVLTFSCLE